MDLGMVIGWSVDPPLNYYYCHEILLTFNHSSRDPWRFSQSQHEVHICGVGCDVSTIGWISMNLVQTVMVPLGMNCNNFFTVPVFGFMTTCECMLAKRSNIPISHSSPMCLVFISKCMLLC